MMFGQKRKRVSLNRNTLFQVIEKNTLLNNGLQWTIIGLWLDFGLYCPLNT